MKKTTMKKYLFVFKNGEKTESTGKSLKDAYSNTGLIDVTFFAIDYYIVDKQKYNFKGEKVI